MNYSDESLRRHKLHGGKIAIQPKVHFKDEEDFCTLFVPGVAQPCMEIYKNSEEIYSYTSKGNMVAVVSDGSAVLGMGNIGAAASVPVMESKAVMFKTFADIDAVPICINTQNTDEIINIVRNISSTFGAVALEDIAAPRCFEIETRLQEALDIPVYHDDQHGTAIVVCAALLNALKLWEATGSDSRSS